MSAPILLTLGDLSGCVIVEGDPPRVRRRVDVAHERAEFWRWALEQSDHAEPRRARRSLRDDDETIDSLHDEYRYSAFLAGA